MVFSFTFILVASLQLDKLFFKNFTNITFLNGNTLSEYVICMQCCINNVSIYLMQGRVHGVSLKNES